MPAGKWLITQAIFDGRLIPTSRCDEATCLIAGAIQDITGQTKIGFFQTAARRAIPGFGAASFFGQWRA